VYFLRAAASHLGVAARLQGPLPSTSGQIAGVGGGLKSLACGPGDAKDREADFPDRRSWRCKPVALRRDATSGQRFVYTTCYDGPLVISGFERDDDKHLPCREARVHSGRTGGKSLPDHSVDL